MTGAPPGRVASRLVRVAATALPAAHRGRYRQELLAELAHLPRRHQLGYALRVLVRSFSLRHALAAPVAVPAAAALVEAPLRPFACRLHLYHRWKTCSTDDGRRFLACASCGKDKEGSGDTIGYIAPTGF